MNARLPSLPVLVVLATLTACGGSNTPPATVEPPVTPPVQPPVQPPVEPPVTPPDTVLSLSGLCQFPRTGRDSNNLPFMDRQGTLANELEWLRLVADDTYLWYKEIPAVRQADYTDKIAYFQALKTPALTPAGRPKDRYHFTMSTESYEASQRGEEYGYGITWLRSATGSYPRDWRVAMVQPGSPAAAAGIQRGDQLVAVDGFDFINTRDAAQVAQINAALTPVRAGEQHGFWLSRNGELLRPYLQSALVATEAVQNTRVIATPTGKVGYLTFNTHNLVAEGQLAKAFAQFRAQGVSDLVLDLRYNGGGLLNIASELAYMVAGPAQTSGKTFELTIGNDKSRPRAPIPFRGTAIGYAGPDKLEAGTPLPSLGLKRVTVLAGPGTCSASESVVNSLRGIDVEVNLVGGATCGKPYAFTPASNCGTTYFTIQYQGVNHKGFGAYDDGFAPTCQAADDLSRPLGDSSEGMLATALRLRETGMCATPSAALRSAAPMPEMVPVRSKVSELKILR